MKDENDPMKKEMEQLKQQLDAEKKQKQDAMKELHLQVQPKILFVNIQLKLTLHLLNKYFSEHFSSFFK